MLAQLAYDEFVSHIPECCKMKAYADMGVKLPTSTFNDWMHRMASDLYPLYESQCELIRSSDYLQADEMLWRIADSLGMTCKGYAWQFLDARPERIRLGMCTHHTRMSANIGIDPTLDLWTLRYFEEGGAL